MRLGLEVICQHVRPFLVLPTFGSRRYNGNSLDKGKRGCRGVRRHFGERKHKRERPLEVNLFGYFENSVMSEIS